MRRVVITGIGVISPIGIGAKPFWENLLAGKIGVRRISLFDPSGLPSQIGGQVPDYKIGDYVPKSYRKATKVMARDIELAVIAADDAFKDAGLQSKAYSETPAINSQRFGCNIGAGLISADLNELTGAMHVAREGNKLDLQRWGRDGMNQLTPLWLLKYLPNMLACHVTIIHGLKGPSNTITCAEASSHLAIGEAFRTIQRGDADCAICGGAETKLVPMSLMRQILLKRVTDSHNDSPETAVRPFDSEATGTAVAEGGGLFILEEYEHAKQRGAKIYAELIGFGASQDTYSVTMPDPSGHSYGKAVSKAIQDAGVQADDVNLLVPHGLGIPSHDRAELAGLKTALGDALSNVALAPIKAQTGNIAAGSGVDAAAAVLSLHHGRIPAALNTRKTIDGVKLNVRPEVRDAKIDIAVSSVYSLGGQNAALVFRRV
ncbi:MAG TPA: beta-ketoacyl synthase N-terminal-like domain-containing protein [Tepidisphaeraceae bacterium]|nr:beta-ketoacyl synthase N-terminal-like domain-containing protein [Tepidisphaeraceae bacterium]